MATSKRQNAAYQYEPLVTPGGWRGDELRYAIRLTQIIDDLYQKYGVLKNGQTAAPEVDTTSILASVYPVGSVYLSLDSTSPAELFGGTWEQIKDTFLLAAGDAYEAGATGGEAEHTLTTDEMPSHTHRSTTQTVDSDTYPDYKFQIVRNLNSASTARYGVAAGSAYNVIAVNPSAADYVSINDISTSDATAPTGGGSAHNNMPPYLAVYVWKRTA